MVCEIISLGLMTQQIYKSFFSNPTPVLEFRGANFHFLLKTAFL